MVSYRTKHKLPRDAGVAFLSKALVLLFGMQICKPRNFPAFATVLSWSILSSRNPLILKSTE